MKAYLWAFINFKQKNWARLLPITKFAYNNAKNVNTGYTSFELNYGYYPKVVFEENINPCSKFKSVNKLLAELQELMTVCRKNIHHAQKLQKQAHNKGVKPRSYTLGDKVW